jgi:beta-galactosidase
MRNLKKDKVVKLNRVALGMNKYILTCVFMIIIFSSRAQTNFGTQIWIEPGYTKTQIFEYVDKAKKCGFQDIRIFAMWTHIEPEPDKWNFEVYDWIFEACEKHKLRLQVTLNPNQPAHHYGKDYWGSIHSHAIFTDVSIQPFSARYIRKVVERYKNSPALDNWWLMNEPFPQDNEDNFSLAGFRSYLQLKYIKIDILNKKWNTSFSNFSEINNVSRIYRSEWAVSAPYYDWIKYSNKHLTDFQRWVRDEVYKYDQNHTFHTNPGAYLSLYHRQDGKEWKSFLNSFGLSIHPSWHFPELFTPVQYSMGVGATCELGRNLANPKPFWISELSGGDNMFRYCPSTNELAQWTWTGIAKGAQKIIYWLLNARTAGLESGEWALLDFQGEPGVRLKMIKQISECQNLHSEFFRQAKPIESKVVVLLSPESSMTYDRKEMKGSHTQSAMGCYQALVERGISVRLDQTHNFAWSKCKGQAVIISDMITLPDTYIDSVKVLINNGNKLIVLGPSWYYNENEECKYLNFPFSKEFGSAPKEIRTVADRVTVKQIKTETPLNAYKIQGVIKNNSATPICMDNEEVTGIRNQFDKSEIVWIPSGISLGAVKFGNSSLSDFLGREVSPFVTTQPFAFYSKSENAEMHTMTDGNAYLTVITNGLERESNIRVVNRTNKTPHLLYSSYPRIKDSLLTKEIKLLSKECLVVYWY